MTKTLVGTPDPEEPNQYPPYASTSNGIAVTNTATTAGSSSTAISYINAYYNMTPSSTNG
jgi:hypothetical protein